MDEQLEALERKVGKRRDFDSPPLHLWHPPLSGDIPIVISTDGSWFHEGGRIERDSLVRLFASILRREEDGDYYRVTHDADTLILLKADTLVIPVRNTTVEDLSHYLLETLVEDRHFLEAQDIREIEVMVSSGPGQTGSSFYEVKPSP